MSARDLAPKAVVLSCVKLQAAEAAVLEASQATEMGQSIEQQPQPPRPVRFLAALCRSVLLMCRPSERLPLRVRCPHLLPVHPRRNESSYILDSKQALHRAPFDSRIQAMLVAQPSGALPPGLLGAGGMPSAAVAAASQPATPGAAMSQPQQQPSQPTTAPPAAGAAAQGPDSQPQVCSPLLALLARSAEMLRSARMSRR